MNHSLAVSAHSCKISGKIWVRSAVRGWSLLRNVLFICLHCLWLLHELVDAKSCLLPSLCYCTVTFSLDLVADKAGVIISCDRAGADGNVACGDIRMDEPVPRTAAVTFQIHNSSLAFIQLEKCYLLFEHHGFKIAQAAKFPHHLQPSMKATVKVDIVIDQIGVRRDWFVCEFKIWSGVNPPPSTAVPVRIVRFLSVRFTDSVTSDPSMHASAPFKVKPVKVLKTNQDDVVDGRKLDM